MKKILLLLLVLIAAYFWLAQDFNKAALTYYYNGNIITLNDEMPRAESMVVENGLIIEIGDSIPSEHFKNRVDLEGATVLPGFIDSHSHVALSSFLESMVDLSGFTHSSDRAVWAYLKQEVANYEPGEWIICKGLDPILVADLQTPDIQFLDALAPDNPVMILSQSLHTYWANSLAFEKAEISRDTVSPSESSYYEKDSQGNLTGLIVEQEALLPFYEIMLKEALTSSVLLDSTVKVMQGYAQNGNTTVVSAGISITNAKPLRLYQHLSDQKPVFLNQLLSKLGFLPEREANPRHFLYMRHDRVELLPENKTENDFYNILGVKHWYDGSPYTGSMYLQKPYLDSDLTRNGLHIAPGYAGKALLAPGELQNFIKQYHQQGWQIAVHAQGDQANHEVVQAFADVNQTMDVTSGRHRIEHALMISTDSLNELHNMGMSANFHTNHLYYYGQALQQDILGTRRAGAMLPIAFAQGIGMQYSMHADQPMFESKPFHLMQTAIERKTKEGTTIGIEHSIQVDSALKAMTIQAAWQIGMENKIGSLEQGKYADFIVVDADPYAVPLEKIKDIKVQKTFVHGNEIITP
ncbi:MAG: amidohydrolase [Gammaproteobacteria bacterium]|nr:amidohydrolase [Gammaproteobacteria bacterium]NNC97081.1 amidohydrolase [Gammaproteobacteria bacterium]NNM14068.1 amidohydrolase [Gammaproteobacteria bacterium]